MRKIAKKSYFVLFVFLFLFVSGVCVKAATYESASFWTGTYMYGTITTSDSYNISGKTAISGDPGTTKLTLKGVPYAGISYTVTATATRGQSVTNSVHSPYSLKEYYGTHRATVASTTKTVGTYLVKS